MGVRSCDPDAKTNGFTTSGHLTFALSSSSLLFSSQRHTGKLAVAPVEVEIRESPAEAFVVTAADKNAGATNSKEKSNMAKN